MEYIIESKETRIKEMSVFEVVPPEEYRTGKQKRYYPKKCFEKAFQYMIDVRPKDGVLVHGKYSPFKGPEDLFSYMEHAWLELPEDIVFDGVLQRLYRKVDYYNYYHAVKVYEYTYGEAVKKASIDYTSGPWEYDILMKSENGSIIDK